MTTSTEPTHAKQPVSTERADDTFVGRRRELEAISRSLAAVASRGGRLEIVSGAPGIGKTRLTHEVAAIARGRGFYVLRGGCWEGEGAPAYWPWADVLRNHLGAPRDDAAGTAIDFSQLLEVAATRAGVPVRGIVDPSKDAQQARFMLFDRFCEFLAATAGGQPVLVIIDDVQSADIGSLLLLQFLAGRLAKLPIALLVTSRDPLSEMTASTSRHAWARHIVLHGLSRSEARALLAARAARTPGRAVLDRLMHLTDGNPYFLKELGQLLVDGEAGFDPTGAVALPASLLVVTLQPYHRLSVGCRSLLQAASVVGREFDAELAARAAGLPIREALGLLDEAVERRVVTAAGAARYHFAHALVREAIHDQLHPSDRTRLHESIAVALERQAEEGERVSAATLAHHFCKALPLTQRRQAALYCIAAGESAHTAFAYEEAVFQLRRAQEISGTSLTELESCDLLLRLGAAEAGAGEWARSRRTFEDAAAVARRINCPERLAHAALGFKGMM
ncbi:MAG TPA: BREX system ATP-binding domain-containing protein, partial [Candidatus Dormibacteraeota bacterium]|nr:BREX system ATP-binding domain-containing protein [Candidatus Dormibacteraeota bacterium]